MTIAVDNSALPFDNPSEPEKLLDQEMKTLVQDCCKETISQLKKQITYLTSWQESGFSDVSKAKVDEVQKQLHKEDMGEKKVKEEGMVPKNFVMKTLRQQKDLSRSIGLKPVDRMLK